MKFVSTKDLKKKVFASKAILQDICNDGGVYVPSSLPILNGSTLRDLSDMDFAERMAKVLSLFINELSFESLLLICRRAYEIFEEDTSIVKVEDGLYMYETWHGPSYSHKDVYTSIYPYLIKAFYELDGEQKKILLPLLVDDNLSKIKAFEGVEWVEVVAFYNENLSKVIKRILLTDPYDNVITALTSGTRNEIKAKIDELMRDEDIISCAKDILIPSISEANPLKLIVSIACAISSYCDLVASDEIDILQPINFATSNFASAVGAYYAHLCGLPIAKIIIGTNVNNTLVDFINSGEYNENREVYRTMSPLVDEVDKSMLERLLFEICDRDCERVDKLIESLHTSGGFSLGNRLPDIFEAGWADEEETKDTIFTFFDLDDYVMDSNSAVGASVYNDYSCDTEDDTPTIIECYECPYLYAIAVCNGLNSKERDEERAVGKLQNMTALECPYDLQSNEPLEDENNIKIDRIKTVLLQGIKALANEE